MKPNTITTKQDINSETAFDSADRVFSPLNNSYSPRRDELGVPSLPMANSNDNAMLQKFIEKRQKARKRKKLILASLISIFIISLLSFFVLEFTFNTEVNETNVEEANKECNEVNTKYSAQLMLQYSVRSTTLLAVRDMTLPCLSNASFKLVSSAGLISYLILENVIIDVIDENAFVGDNMSISVLEIRQSKIGNFRNQETLVDLVRISYTEISKFPLFFPVRGLYFDEILNFIPTIDFIYFLASSPKRNLVIHGMLDDEKLQIFLNLILNENKIIKFDATECSFGLTSNNFTYLPNNLFSSDKFVFTADKIVLSMRYSQQLTLLDSGVFSGMLAQAVEISLSDCEELKNLPTSLVEVDLISLSISNTDIESLDGIDFSVFPNLLYIELEETPFQPTCADEAEFRQKYGISETVSINTCQ
eukprot:snap_masked-scaffold_8-processed-gene-4.36-mRNA-1 protein AED:1.00 eAED:1.00 QI:0/0/0/0/1/1/2/0/419